MSESTALTDVAARLQALKEQAEAVDVTSGVPVRTRFVVATDWSQAAAPFAVLKAYRAAFAPDDAVELCLATPHEPGAVDAECARSLLESVGGDAVCGPVTVESFDEVVTTAYDSAVVPTGDAGLLIMEVAGIVSRMFDVSRRAAAGEVRINGGNPGSRDALRERLQAFTA